MAYNALLAIKEQTGKSISGGGRTVSSGRSIDDEKKAGKEALNENPSSLTKMLSDPETVHATSTNEYLANTLGDKATQPKQPEKTSVFRKLFGGNDKPTYLTDEQYDEEDRKDSANPLQKPLNLTQQIEKKKSDLAKAEEVAAYAVDADAGSKAAKDVARIKSELDRLEELDGKKKTSVIDWAKNVGGAAGNSYLSGLTGTQETLFEMGSGYRSKEAEARMKELEPQIERQRIQYEDLLNSGEYDPAPAKAKLDELQAEYDALKKGYSEEVSAGAAKGASDIANNLALKAQEQTQAAKDAAGNTFVGDLVTDASISGIQSLADRVLGFGLGGAGSKGLGLANMGLRVFGSSSMEAMNDGATLPQRVSFGAANVIKEIGTESALDVMKEIPALAKGGWVNDSVEKVIAKYAKTDSGRTALRTLFAFLGEAAEEGVGGAIDPSLKAIYQGKEAFKGYNKQQAAETLYSMLVGGVSGAAGQTANVILGGNATANEKIRVAEAVAQNQNIYFNTAYDMVESELNRGKSLQQVSQENTITPDAASQISAVEQMQDRGEQAQPAEATAPTPLAEQERRTSGEERAEAKAPSAPVYSSELAQFSDEEISDLTRKYGSPKRFVERIIPEAIRTGEFVIDLSFNNQNIIPSIANRYLYSLGYELKSDGFSTVDDTQRYRVVPINDSVETTSQTTEAPTVETANPIVRTLQERSTAGETRAEEMAPEAPRQNPLLREEQPVEAEQTAPSNPLLDTLQPMSAEERNMTGEERAEEQAPETPATPVDAKAERASRRAELENRRASIEEQIQKYQSEIDQIKKDANSQKTLEEIKLYKQQSKDALDYYTGEIKNLQGQLEPIISGLRAIASEENAEKRQASIERAEIEGSKKVPNPTAEKHIDNRTLDDASKRNVNAFQYDNPEVKPFFKKAAVVLRRDLLNASANYVKGYGAMPLNNTFMKRAVAVCGSVSDAIQACEQLIYDKGRENFADPKKLELILDDMLSKGYSPSDSSLPVLGVDNEYLRTKGRLSGGTEFNEDARARAIQSILESDFEGLFDEQSAAEWVDQNFERTGSYDTATMDGASPVQNRDGYPTLDELDAKDTADLEVQYGKYAPKAEAKNNDESASTEPITPTNENAQQESENHEQAPSQQFNSNTESTTEETPQNGNPEPPTPPENPTDNLGTKTVPTQSVVHDVLTEEEKARPELNPENDTHIQHSDELVHQQARQTVDADPAKARSDLMNTEDGKMWTDVQVETANIIIQEEIDRIRAMQPGAEQDAAYAELAKFKDKYNKQGTDAARALRMRQNLNSSADIISEASTILYGEENQSKLRKMTPEKKSEIMQQVADGTAKLDDIISRNDTQSLIDTIKEYAGIRKTRGLLDTKNKALDKVLNEVLSQDGGEEFLQNILRTQISSVASDYINPGAVNKLKAYKFLAALSNLQTASNNVGANTVFGSFMDAVSANASIAGDAFMSLFTGKRTVGFERLSKAGIKGGYDAGLRSWLEVSLDADTESSSTKYEEFKGRTFKANSNSFLERMLAAWERNIAYQMETTDAVAKGSIAAETERSLANIADGKTAEETGQNEALYRSLQEDSAISKATIGVRDLLNKVAHIGNEKTGTYGLGDFLLMFAKVPANAVKTQLDINPVMIPKHLYDAVKIMAKGKNATFAEQRSAAKALGQSVNGVALVALATVLSAKGVIDYTEPDDKDEKALYDAEGKTGLQINLSALKRWISGDNTEWASDDNLISLGWLPQLNSILIIGNMIYKDSLEYGEDTTAFEKMKDVGVNSVTGMLKSLSQFPAVSTISGMLNAYKYADVDPEASEKEQTVQRIGAVGSDALGDLASGFTPNALAAIAKGLDPYERNTNTGDGAVSQAINTFKSKIPGLREDLPKRYDGYGNPLKSNNPLLDMLDSTTIPGDIDKYNPYAHDEELSRIGEANGKSYFPDRNAPNSIKLGDGAELELDASQKETWIQTEGKSLSKMQDEFFASDYYNTLSDESKGAVLDAIEKYSKYLANQSVSSDADVDFKNKEFDGLLGGVDTYGTAYDKTALNEESIVPYYAFKYGLKDLTGKVDSGDPTAYSAIDSMIKDYASLDDNLKTVLAERCDEQNLEKLLTYDSLGIGSQSYYTVKKAITDVTHEHDKSGNASGAESLEGLIRADIPESEKITLVENYEQTGVVNKTQYQSYTAMKDYGVSLESLYDFGEDVKYRVDKETGEVKVKTSNFDAASAAFAISQIPGLSDDERSAIFNSLKGEWSNYYNDWKNYTYQSEIDYINSDRCKYLYGVDAANGYGVEGAEGSSTGTTYKKGSSGYYKRRGYGGKSSATKSPTINKQLTKLLHQGSSQSASKIKNRSYAPSLNNSKSSSYEYFKQRIKA